jgi:hypothetical protein
MFFFLFLIFLIVGASLWFQGLWSAGLSLVNILLAAMIATNVYEPIAAMIEGFDRSFTHLLDFTVLWIVFAVTFGILRLFTDMLSKTRVQFDMPVEMVGRSLLAVWAAFLFVSFTAFSLHMAPLNNPTPLGAWQSPGSGVFFNADRLWLRFMHSRSRGALARGNSGAEEQYPGDEDVQTFDPHGRFPLKYHERRMKYANAEEMRVQ